MNSGHLFQQAEIIYLGERSIAGDIRDMSHIGRPTLGRIPGAAKVAIGLIAMMTAVAASSQIAELRIGDPPTIDPELDDAEERNNLSGAACDGSGICLMVGDEKRYARRFTIDGEEIQPQGRIFLLPKNLAGQEMGETDAEGAAFADGFFYVVGSHSRNRRGEAEPSRHYLYRIRSADLPAANADFGTAEAPSPTIRCTTLDRVIARDGLLNRHLSEAPGETRQGAPSHGTNVEGIAVAAGRLYVGFRGPVDEQGAVILSVPTTAIFPDAAPAGCPTGDALSQAPAPAATSHRVDLFGGQGVRDLAAVRGGLLILAGPETRLATPNPHLFYWSPGPGRPVHLAMLTMPAHWDSPEAIVVLEETATEYRILVLSDGDSGGVPTIVRVPKPSS